MVELIDPLLQTPGFRRLERRQNLVRALMLVGFLLLFAGAVIQITVLIWVGLGLLALSFVLRLWAMVGMWRTTVRRVRRVRRG